MASPFAVFRRNQKVLTVILTCLAMFAFIILDSVSQMETSAIMPIVFGLAGAGLAWLWGSQNERGISYSTIGFGAVAGALAGAMVISQYSNQGGVSTALGRLSNRDLLEMKQKRDFANQFIVSAFRERGENAYPFMMERYTFGGTSTREVVFKKLLHHEADQLGISISDQYITNYIKDVSGDSITRKKLTEIRGQIGVGESELYDLLRSELRVRVAYRVLNPQVVHMPDQYWGDFEKLNVRHSIDAVAIPVEPFAKRLLRPSDAELVEVFEAFKSVYPMAENPGFRQPDRLKLAWFESNSDFEAAEKLVGEISEEDLKARYEERKEDEYKIQTLPDFGSELDDGGLKFGDPPAPEKTTPPAGDDDKSTDEAPKTKEAPEAGAPKSDPDAPAKRDGDAPADPPKAAKGDPATPAPADDKESTPEADECGDGDDQDATSDQKQEKSDAVAEPTDAESKSDDESQPAGKTKPVDSKPKPAAEAKPAGETPPAGDATKPAEKTKESPKPDNDASKSATDAADKTATESTDPSSEKSKDPAAAPVPEIKYRSFEEVRDEIRDDILIERTEARVAGQIAAALAAVKEWRFNIREQEPEITNEKLAADIARKAKAFAAANDLQFVNADEFLSYSELSEHAEYSIGKAREPFDMSQITNRTEPQTVPARLFTGATSLFIPEEAEGQLNDTRYVFWATGEQESHVPETLDEPGVREKVEEAVRMQKARPEAEARAKKLAEELTAKFAEMSIVSMAEGIAGQTILGAEQPEAGKSTANAGTVEPKGDDAKTADGVGTELESGAGDVEESANEESCADEDEKEPTPQAASDEEADPAKKTEPAKKADPAKPSDPDKKETTPSAPKLVLDDPEPVGDEPQAVGNAPQPIEEVTADEPTADSLAVISSRPFTWYRQSSQGMQMNPFAEPTVEFGVINGIDGVDDNFMQAVSEAALREVVVIPNVTKQIYYVVYVKARNPSGNNDPGMGPVRQQFIMENVPMSRIYGRLARVPASDIQQKWQEAFLLKHNVDSAELDAI